MSEDLRHTFVYRGRVELNFNLAADATHFLTAKGEHSAIRQPKLEGLVFGFMEPLNDDVVITQVDEVILDCLVPVSAERHLDIANSTGRRVGDLLGPGGKNISERAALNALDDAVTANPRLKGALEPKRTKLRPT